MSTFSPPALRRWRITVLATESRRPCTKSIGVPVGGKKNEALSLRMFRRSLIANSAALMPYMLWTSRTSSYSRATDDQQYATRKGSDGYYFGLKIGRKRVGHVGGIEKQTSGLNDQGQYVPAHYFDVMNVSLDEDQRRQVCFSRLSSRSPTCSLMASRA